MERQHEQDSVLNSDVGAVEPQHYGFVGEQPEAGVSAVPPVPTLPPMARFSERFKSVWSDTSAGTVESGSDTKPRDFGSILVGYEHSEWGGSKTDKTEKKADPDAGR